MIELHPSPGRVQVSSPMELDLCSQEEVLLALARQRRQQQQQQQQQVSDLHCASSYTCAYMQAVWLVSELSGLPCITQPEPCMPELVQGSPLQTGVLQQESVSACASSYSQKGLFTCVPARFCRQGFLT